MYKIIPRKREEKITICNDINKLLPCICVKGTGWLKKEKSSENLLHSALCYSLHLRNAVVQLSSLLLSVLCLYSQSKGNGRISRQRELFEPNPFCFSFPGMVIWYEQPNEQRMQRIPNVYGLWILRELLKNG